MQTTLKELKNNLKNKNKKVDFSVAKDLKMIIKNQSSRDDELKSFKKHNKKDNSQKY